VLLVSVGVLAWLGVGVLAWIAKQVLGALLSQQVKGSIPEYTTAKAIAAAELLPPQLGESYLRYWLAELHTLEPKPLSALRYSGRLANAARTIANRPGQLNASAGLVGCDARVSTVQVKFPINRDRVQSTGAASPGLTRCYSLATCARCWDAATIGSRR
jgi:hypothetical protein